MKHPKTTKRNPPLISIDKVSKTYESDTALSIFCLKFWAGDRVAVLGPSGSGKTTLLNLIGRVINPNHGTIEFVGKNLANIKPGKDLSSLVGLIHQQLDLVPHLSVIHNVMAGRLGHWSLTRSLLSLISPRETHLAHKALQHVGIADKIYTRTSQLSGGEQQRVAIARLLVQQPMAILADEPIASLDPPRAEDLVRLLTTVVSDPNKILVASLHSIHLTKKYFSRAIGLRNGKLQFDLPTEKLNDKILQHLYQITTTEQ